MGCSPFASEKCAPRKPERGTYRLRFLRKNVKKAALGSWRHSPVGAAPTGKKVRAEKGPAGGQAAPDLSQAPSQPVVNWAC